MWQKSSTKDQVFIVFQFMLISWRSSAHVTLSLMVTWKFLQQNCLKDVFFFTFKGIGGYKSSPGPTENGSTAEQNETSIKQRTTMWNWVKTGHCKYYAVFLFRYYCSETFWSRVENSGSFSTNIQPPVASLSHFGARRNFFGMKLLNRNKISTARCFTLTTGQLISPLIQLKWRRFQIDVENINVILTHPEHRTIWGALEFKKTPVTERNSSNRGKSAELWWNFRNSKVIHNENKNEVKQRKVMNSFG